MALVTRPSRAAYSFWTKQSAAIEQVSEQIVDVHKQASPTMRILLKHARTKSIGPDEKFGWNFLHDMYNVSAVNSKNVEFAAPDLDPISRQEWTVKSWYTSGGTNQFEMSRYKSNFSRIGLVDEKVQAMHAGLTWVYNYMLFSNFSEDDITDIDLSSELSNGPVPPPVKFQNLTTTGGRIFSIPMIVRKNVTGHTIGNVNSDNPLWQPTVTDNGTVVRNTTSTDTQCDVVTNDHSTTVAISMKLIKDHLRPMQRGYQRRLYAAMPGELFAALEEYVEGYGQIDLLKGSELLDLSINAALELRSYNTVFYVDPMMDDLWPNTIWYYDPECMFMVFNEDFNPMGGTGIYPWERIPGTNQSAMAIFFEGQLACPDMRGVGAQHGLAES